MSLTVTLLSGPRRSGKSLIAGLIIDEVLDHRPHYLRLTAVNGGKRPAVGIAPPRERCAVASAQWLCYECERVFEVLPEMLAAIHRKERNGRVIIEADAPQSLSEVFRTSVQAARALQDVLDDTAEFAAEIFGVSHGGGYLDDDTRQERDLLSKSDIRRFLGSPLGDQLATRIQLHPEYHGLVESDVVLINTAAGGVPAIVDGCCRRLERLLSRIHAPGTTGRPVFCCDPADLHDPRRREFVELLRTLCRQTP